MSKTSDNLQEIKGTLEEIRISHFGDVSSDFNLRTKSKIAVLMEEIPPIKLSKLTLTRTVKEDKDA